MPNEIPTTEARLAELAGAPHEAFSAKVKASMAMAWPTTECPCDNGATCQWPRCGKTGSGIGHYP